jgi:tRNA(fMet)-specific endonuclease VapC
VLYLLDTNTVSIALRGRAPQAVYRLRSTDHENVALSIVTALELRYGLAKNPTTKARQVVEALLDTMRVLPLDRSVEKPYALLRTTLERLGRPIGALDTLIAAHALAAGAVLVTNNLREFRRVRGLKCEDWTT